MNTAKIRNGATLLIVIFNIFLIVFIKFFHIVWVQNVMINIVTTKMAIPTHNII